MQTTAHLFRLPLLTAAALLVAPAVSRAQAMDPDAGAAPMVDAGAPPTEADAGAAPMVVDAGAPLAPEPAVVDAGAPLAVEPMIVDAGAPAAPVVDAGYVMPIFETVVTSRQTDKTPFNTAIGTNVVTGQRVEELMPRNVAEALRNQPGVWVQQTGLMGGTAIVRGLIGNDVIYLFDGVRRNTVSLYPGANPYLNTADPMSVERIEVIRGPGSVLYGSDGLGGVLNVITARPLHFTDGETKLSGELAEWFESADRGTMTGFRADATTSDVFVHLGGSYTDAKNVVGGGDDGVLPRTSFFQQGLNGQFGAKISDHDAVELLVQWFDRPYATRYDNVSWVEKDERDMYVLRYHGTNKGFMDSLEAEAYYHNQFGWLDSKYFDSRSTDQTIGAEVQGRSEAGPISLTYGLHYHHDSSSGSDPLNKTVDPDVTWDNPAAFVLAQWAVSPLVTFEAGVRGDYFVFASKAPPAGASIPAGLSADNLVLSRSDFAPTGSVDAVVKLERHVNLTLSGGTGFRAPNKNDYLAVGPFTLGYDTPPSGTLSPERSYQVEAGLRTNFHRFISSASVYYTYLNQLITSAPATFNGSSTIDADGTTYDVYSPKNVDSAWATGAEGAVRVGLTENLWFYGNLSWMRGFQSDGEPLAYEYPVNGTAGLRWQDDLPTPYYLEFEAFGAERTNQIQSFVATSDPAYLVNPQNSHSGSILENGYLPGFTILNARAGVELNRYLALTMNLGNLTNERYRMKDTRIDGPGFDAIAGLRIKY